ncbi:MAG: GNVR domain-containing protein, partial [Nitrospirales bacterium]
RLVLELRAEIQLIEEFIQEQENALSDRITTGTNPMYQQIALEAMSAENQLKSLLSKQETIKQQLTDLSTQLAHLDTYEREIETLELRVATDRQNHERYLNKVEEARISEEMDHLKMANISVIQPASLPIRPVKPKKMLNIMMGFIVGLVAGFSAAFLSEYVGGSYIRPEQLGRDLELPILVSVANKRA